jgi:hypothetical protein
VWPVEVKIVASFEAGVPRPLFPMRPNGVLRYDVTAGAQRFLVSSAQEEAAVLNPATVVLNWSTALNKK